MRKINLFSVVCLLALFVASHTGCKKEEVNNNGNNNGYTENPGGGSGDGNYNNQEYPSTANVIRRAVTDIDGTIYDAVQIGTQVWMAENLRTTKYADGTTILLGTSTSTTTAYRYAPGQGESNEENMANVARYGYLYNWPAVMHGASSSEANPSGVQGICPNGWHVPSNAEWTQLTNYVGSQTQYQCDNNSDYIAKALASTTGWNSSTNTCTVGNNPDTNNAIGFSALPAGYYSGGYGYSDGYGGFGDYAYFWSATESYDYYAHFRFLYYDFAFVFRSYTDKYNGQSVRCVRD